MSDVPAVDPADFTDEAIRKLAPECQDCGPDTFVQLVRGSVVYPQRLDLADGWYWWCGKCRGYTGTHKGTLKPKGTPAGRETRQARIAAHAAFDPLWKLKAQREGINPNRARTKGYKWLAAQLGIDPKNCHIGMLSAHDANRVTALCRGRIKREVD